MNWLWNAGKALPDRSCTPLVAITVTVFSGGSVPALRVTTLLSAEWLTLIFNLLPPANSANVLVFSVDGFSDFENVSTTAAFNPTALAPLLGVINTI